MINCRAFFSDVILKFKTCAGVIAEWVFKLHFPLFRMVVGLNFQFKVLILLELAH